MTKVENKKFKIKKIILGILFVVAIGFTTYNIVHYFVLDFHLNRVNRLVETINKKLDIKEIDGTIYNNYNGQYKNEKLISVDLTKTKNYNQDISGYIKISGTNINTVYTYTEEKDYYLNKTLDGHDNMFGWIYLDNRNNQNMENNNNIFYGHGIPNKTLFSGLKKLVKEEWFENNKHLIYTSTQDKGYLWEIFSTYYIKDNAEYLNTTYSQEYIEKIIKLSTNDFNVEVNTEDKIITLVTCYSLDGYHSVVHGKLIKIN